MELGEQKSVASHETMLTAKTQSSFCTRYGAEHVPQRIGFSQKPNEIGMMRL